MKILLLFLLSVSVLASLPTVNFVVEKQLVSEKSGEVTVLVKLSSVANNDVVVPFKVSGTARVNVDHNLREGEFYISKGSKVGYITFSVFDDDVVENEESLIITFLAAQNANLGSLNAHEITITDITLDVPIVNFSTEEQTKNEGERALVVAVLSAPATQFVTVPFEVSGTALYNLDHHLINGNLIFAPGSSRTEISVDIELDSEVEGQEDIYIELFGPVQNGRIGNKDTHRIIINDLN